MTGQWLDKHIDRPSITLSHIGDKLVNYININTCAVSTLNACMVKADGAIDDGYISVHR